VAYAARDLADQIESGWNLTGRLSKTSTDTMKEIVYFFGHPQIPVSGEFTKAVEVRKIKQPEQEYTVTHPKFREVRDRFEITCRYRLLGGDEDLYDEAETDIEDMCDEVIRILATVYNPTNGTGTFFTVTTDWQNRDAINVKPELNRVLYFTLTQIKSRIDTVFRGFGGVLAFDDSASTGDTKRGSDYTYTEAYNVRYDPVGYVPIPHYNRLGINPIFNTGPWAQSNFYCEMYAKKADVSDANVDQLDNIYKALNSGKLAEVVFLDSTNNTESPVATLTDAIKVIGVRVGKQRSDEALVVYTVRGTIMEPITTTVN
jgi:hypothetical protein